VTIISCYVNGVIRHQTTGVDGSVPGELGKTA